MKFLIGVKAIIRDKGGKILVVRRANGDDHKPGFWETPGGRMDEMDAPQKALEREIKEEVNLKVYIREPFNVFKFKRDTGEQVVGITFLCDYKSGKLKLSNEHDAFKWIDPKDFRKLQSVPSLYKEIQNYSKKYGK